MADAVPRKARTQARKPTRKGPSRRTAPRRAKATRRKAPVKSGKAAAARASGRARRPSPAPKGVKVQRPAVHAPAPLATQGPAFEVRLDASQLAQATSPMAAAAKVATQLSAGGGPSPAATPGPGLTYAGSGVDIHREDKAIEALAGMVNFTRTGFGAPLSRIGHFAGLVDFGAEHALVLCTDGVGSKVEMANAIRKWDTVGIDCVAMCVNDCI